MVKSKQPNLVPGPTKRKKSSGDAKANLLVEDDWILVKKQRINIIIPPSPGPKQGTLPNAVETEPQTELIVVHDSRADPDAIVHDQMHSLCDKEISDSSIPERDMEDDSGICPQPNPARLDLMVADHRVVSRNPCVENFRDHRTIGDCNSSRVIKRLPIAADRNAIVNRRMRTLMIKKKLEQVGGLSKWLISLGLESFIKVFRCKGIDKYHLACLTTGKLKQMGVYTVGPRRKLLQAIDRICQPYCFR
ncbi:hypothetical protein LIER_11206 [Lithospermum erythrorhizon]|uniref:SAM domain-containing protein n=1 Tax=Lithospermum erythrorhizon TaxID=34254 RepID=A0AAV3PR83_LITER